MPSFAKAISEPGTCREGMIWLAGLLEAEGTFLRPPPSMPNCPIVCCRMTDRDVVERVAAMFGTRVLSIDKGRYRTEYAATLKGSRAVTLMSELKPMMGSRRQRAIDSALAAYSPPTRKLDFVKAEQIRRRHDGGETASALARSFAVTHPTVRAVLKRRIYNAPEQTRWREPASFLRVIPSLPGDLSLPEFLWLAGWLEGEGSFLAPPPSDPRRPRISGKSRDRDVVAEVGRLLRVSPSRTDVARTRKHGWSPTWGVQKAGLGAILIMRALEPIMGERRSAQILRALAAARAAQTEPGPHQSFWKKWRRWDSNPRLQPRGDRRLQV